MSLVCVAVLHLAAAEPATAVGPEGGGTKGICVKILKDQFAV
jgi:hypothetical protein